MTPLTNPCTQDPDAHIFCWQHGPLCLGVQDLAISPLPIPSSEDCLFIDVWAPSPDDNNTNNPSPPKPVLVWIQGGAFVNLFNPNYNGSGLIEASGRDAIVVTFNYRVGAHGFLAGAELEAEGNLNIGLHDQRMAIRWVEEHIDKFGGDPGRVTLFGTSIGAGSVLLHSMAYGGNPPPGKELNWQAGIATAVNVPPVYTVEELEHQYQMFLEAVGCESLACLRGLSSDDFQAANSGRPLLEGQSTVPLFPSSPVIDSSLLLDTPSRMATAGNFSTSRPLIIGSGRSEGTLFAPQANSTHEVSSFISTQFPLLTLRDVEKAQEMYADTPATYPGVTAPLAPYFYRLAEMYGDAGFSCPALHVATSMRDAGTDIHLLRNAVVDPVELAAGLLTPHTWEVEAVWGPGYATQYVALPGADSYREGGENHEIVHLAQSYWLNFAKTLGDPTAGQDVPPWARLNEGSARLRIKAGDTVMETIEEQELARCRFWDSVSDKTRI